MKTCLALVVCSSLLQAGCGSKEAASPETKPKSASQSVSIENMVATSASTQPVAETQPAPPPETPAASPAPMPAAEPLSLEPPIVAFNQLTEALFKFQGKYGRPPHDLNELVTTKYLDKIPKAPPGLKYVFDSSLNIRMARQ